MKTYSVKASEIKREWHVIDAADQVLGRLATQVARLLMGKHKPMFTRNLDTGDYVVVINADKVRVTGNKAKQKVYYRHSGYPGGLKTISYDKSNNIIVLGNYKFGDEVYEFGLGQYVKIYEGEILALIIKLYV